MKLISAAEAGKLWGITQRRVAQMASQSRIQGAVFKGNCWLIPDNAPRPTDNRKRGAKAPEDTTNKYVFPFLLCCVNSEEQIHSFTTEEKKLYQLCLLCESGDFAATRQFAEELLHSPNRYVQLGALFHLPMTCIYLRDFAAADRYTVMFRAEIQASREHREELKILLACFDAELDSFSDLAENQHSPNAGQLPDELIPYTSVFKVFSDYISFLKGDSAVDFSVHELICRLVEAQGYFYSAISIHFYLCGYYAISGDEEHEQLHLKKAINIALEHNIVLLPATMFAYSPLTLESLAGEYPPETLEKMRVLSRLYLDLRNAYVEYRGKSTLLTKLNADDYKLISFCMKGYSVEQMSAAFGLSRSGMNRRLSNLYTKLGVKSKNEMADHYLKSVLDWCGEK